MQISVRFKSGNKSKFNAGIIIYYIIYIYASADAKKNRQIDNA